MKPDQQQKMLFALARALPPSDHVPYAFEKRIMVKLAAQPVLDIWALWSRLLWRAAAPCVGIMLVVSVWSMVSNGYASSPERLAADYERTVWGPLSSLGESW
jgi:hypothetical protein